MGSATAATWKALKANWLRLAEKRPNESLETDPKVTVQMVGEVILHIGSVIDTLESKSLFETSPELATADTRLGAAIARIDNLVKDGVENGFAWLGTTSFLKELTETQGLLAALTAKRISVTREIARDLEKRGLAEIERVVAASQAADNIVTLRKRADASVAEIEQKRADVQAKWESLQSLLDAASNLDTEIKRFETESKAAAASALEIVTRIEGTNKAIQTLKSEAEEREATLQSRIKSSNEQVAALNVEVEKALESVQKALRAARDQGLAHSFQSRSNTLRGERRLWTMVFVGAITVLATLSAVFAIDLYRLDLEGLAVVLLRKLALAAPCVWLGWYAARQVGRVARVQEDYEYKAASALAFQSYKDEAALGADPDLAKRLLQHAIDTFGENPVRLYHDSLSEPVSPLDSGLKNLPIEKLMALLTSALDAAGRKK